MAAKDERVYFRCAQAVKELLEQGAAQDGMQLSSWLRWLGERRVDEQNGVAQPELGNNHKPVAAFVPGFGLNNEEGQ